MPERTGRLSAGECLDLEVLSAYIDGTLDVRERAKVEAHLASCADCYDVMSEVLRIQEAIPAARPALSSTSSAWGTADATPALSSTPPAWAAPERRDAAAAPAPRPSGDTVVRGAFGRRKAVWGVAGGLLAAAAALVLVVRLQPTWWTGGVDPKLADLVEAVGEERTVEARLTGGFKYGPLRSPMRSGGRVGPTDNWSLLAAAGRIREEAEKDPTAENLHALGVASLVIGDAENSVSLLERAIALDSTRSDWQGDLSAAYLTRARNHDRPDDIPKAVEAARLAIEADPMIPEAYFNYALAVEALSLRAQAVAAWREYLRRDAQGPWAADAKRHLEQLEGSPQGAVWRDEQQRLVDAAEGRDQNEVARIVARFRQSVREFVEDDLLPSWAARITSRGAESERASLRAIGLIASALADATNDSLLVDTVIQLEQLKDREPEILAAAAHGLLAFGEARKTYESNAIARAAERFAVAQEALDRGKSPFVAWPMYYVGVARFYRGDYNGVLLLAQELHDRASAKGYVALAGRAAWMAGLTHNIQGEIGPALDSFSQALTLFQSSQETDNEASLHRLLSTAYLYLGEPRQAWLHSVRASALISDQTHPRLRHSQLVAAANMAIRNDLPRAAIEFTSEALENAAAWGAPEAEIEARNYRVRAMVLAGQANQAAQSLASARMRLGSVSDENIRYRLAAEILQTETEVLALVDPVRAVQAADAAVDLFRTQRSTLRLPRLYLARARAHLALGNQVEADSDLGAGIDLFEKERHALPTQERLRLSHSDGLWDLFAERLELAVGTAGPEELLRIADQGRARTLVEQRGRAGEIPAIEALDTGTAVLYYAMLREEMLIWVISHRGLAFHRSRVSRKAIEQTILIMRLALTDGRDASDSIRTLSEWLLAPVSGAIADMARLLIVPDGALHALPFALLKANINARPIGAETAISILPSLSLLSARGSLNGGFIAEPAVLAVAEARGAVEWGLPSLPGVRAEIDLIKQIFPKALVLADRAATKKAVLSAIQEADLVYFGGHAISSADLPAMSKLLLRNGDSIDWVTADDVSALDLPKRPVVVLAACGTNDGRILRGEGVISLGRAFLAAGARSVLASLWNVPDGASMPILKHLFASRQSGVSLAEALRTAPVVDRARSGWVVIGE